MGSNLSTSWHVMRLGWQNVWQLSSNLIRKKPNCKSQAMDSALCEMSFLSVFFSFIFVFVSVFRYFWKVTFERIHAYDDDRWMIIEMGSVMVGGRGDNQPQDLELEELVLSLFSVRSFVILDKSWGLTDSVSLSLNWE